MYPGGLFKGVFFGGEEVRGGSVRIFKSSMKAGIFYHYNLFISRGGEDRTLILGDPFGNDKMLDYSLKNHKFWLTFF